MDSTKRLRISLILLVVFVLITISSLLISYFPTNYRTIILTLGTVATFVAMIVAFFSYIDQKRNKSKDETREIKEVIYSKLYKELGLFLLPKSHTREQIQMMVLPINWSWTAIKSDQFYLAYQVPEKISKQLNEFTEIFDKYKKSFELTSMEIRNKILLELHKMNPEVNIDSYLEVWPYATRKNCKFNFEIFENLFLQKDIRDSLKQFKSKYETDSELVCEFLDGTRKILFQIKNEQEVIQFFEKLFKDIKENSENFKELLRLRQVGMNLAKQILKQISPE